MAKNYDYDNDTNQPFTNFLSPPFYPFLVHAGMFSWVCLATLPIFCHCGWPRDLLHVLRKLSRLPTNRLANDEQDKNIGNEETKAVDDKETQWRKFQEGGEKKMKREEKGCESVLTLKKNSNCYYSGE